MIDQLRPADLPQWFASQSDHGTPVVLDVREPFELEVASVRADGFELLTIPMGTVPQRLAELDPARPVACLCHHGLRSMQVAAFLASHGFEHVANVAGGIHAWSLNVDPTIATY
jgi:rhodanese-related sulfurtransferase